MVYLSQAPDSGRRSMIGHVFRRRSCEAGCRDAETCGSGPERAGRQGHYTDYRLWEGEMCQMMAVTANQLPAKQ